MEVSFGNTRRCQLSYRALGTSKFLVNGSIYLELRTMFR